MGINKKCAQCKEDCKQSDKVELVQCAKFAPKEKP